MAEPRYVSEQLILTQVRRLDAYLHRMDPHFPQCTIALNDFDLRHEFYGAGYGLFTAEGRQAIALMNQQEGIPLDGTYTGKTLAAVMTDTAAPASQDAGPLLFWNTNNSQDFSSHLQGLDYHKLPTPFHHYFETDVQPLDAESALPIGYAKEEDREVA